MSSNPTPISDDFLYKYRTIDESNVERSRRIFTLNEIYLATKNEFNDPFDCKSDYSFTATDKQKNEFFSHLIKEANPEFNRRQRKAKLADYRKGLKSESFKRTIDTFTEKLHAGLGIYSLTRVPDDILMWSHYSDSHKGFCLQFADDPADKFFARAQKIIYSDDYPIVNPVTDDHMGRLEKTLLTKARHWEYENEWRIIDHIIGPGVQNFPEHLLIGVIFGCRMSEGHKTLIREWCVDRMAPPKFYQANEASKKYALDIIEM